MSYWHDKVALITGGSRGLGRAIAAEFSQCGANVVLAARDQQRLEQTAEAIRNSPHQIQAGTSRPGGEVLTITADVTKDEEAGRLVQHTLERFGRLDVLVNCAGRSMRGLALETSWEEYRSLWEVNFLSAVHCTQAAADHLIGHRGHVVNIGSLAAKIAAPYMGAYSSSKFPLAAFSQQLRLELGPRGLHILLVCPGPIRRDEEPADQKDAETGRYGDQIADSELPSSAVRPGGGVKLRRIEPDWLAKKILRACQARRPELIVPGKAKLLLAISQLCPRLGDWIVRKNMS